VALQSRGVSCAGDVGFAQAVLVAVWPNTAAFLCDHLSPKMPCPAICPSRPMPCDSDGLFRRFHKRGAWRILSVTSTPTSPRPGSASCTVGCRPEADRRERFGSSLILKCSSSRYRDGWRVAEQPDEASVFIPPLPAPGRGRMTRGLWCALPCFCPEGSALLPGTASQGKARPAKLTFAIWAIASD